jgi:selenophosphate synthetase-related protein
MTEEAKLFEKINEMAVDIAQIKTKLEMMPPPPKQPCQWHLQLRKEFDIHVDDQKQIKSDWRKALCDGGVDIAKTAIIAIAGMLIALAMGGIL